MNTVIEGQVGPQILADGTQQTIRMGRAAEVLMAELRGKYAEQTFRGNLFWACMSAGVIFPAPAATAANVFTLTNPFGSGKNLNLVSFDMVMSIIPGTPVTGLYGLFVNVVPQAAAVTGTTVAALPGLLGSKFAPVGLALSTTTLPVAPTLLLPFGQKVTGEVATVNPISGLPAFHIEFDGKISLGPGASITPQQTAADTSNATVICAICWEEVPA